MAVRLGFVCVWVPTSGDVWSIAMRESGLNSILGRVTLVEFLSICLFGHERSADELRLGKVDA